MGKGGESKMKSWIVESIRREGTTYVVTVKDANTDSKRRQTFTTYTSDPGAFTVGQTVYVRFEAA